jgi:hypothetical protein
VGTVSGFNALQSARFISIRNTDASVISGFTSMTEAWSVDIQENPQLTEISGFSTLGALIGFSEDLRIQTNPALEAISGFGQLAYISGDLVLTHLGELQDISSLSNISAVGGNIQITDNPNLRSLTWMKNLTFINGELRINSLPTLRSLAGLESVQGVAGLMVVDFNPNLWDCTSIQTLIDEVDDYEPGPGELIHPDVEGLLLRENGNCDTIEQILDQIFLDGYESYGVMDSE